MASTYPTRRASSSARSTGSAPGVVGPGSREVELAVDHRVPARCCVGEIDRDLGSLDPSRSAGVPTLHPDRLRALLEITGLIDHQHRITVAEVGADEVPQVIAHPVGVQHRPGEQVLHTVRISVTGVLGDAPAVVPRQVREQPEQEPASPSAGLHPGGAARHPIEQPVGFNLPTRRSYAVHRLIF